MMDAFGRILILAWVLGVSQANMVIAEGPDAARAEYGKLSTKLATMHSLRGRYTWTETDGSHVTTGDGEFIYLRPNLFRNTKHEYSPADVESVQVCDGKQYWDSPNEHSYKVAPAKKGFLPPPVAGVERFWKASNAWRGFGPVQSLLYDGKPAIAVQLGKLEKGVWTGPTVFLNAHTHMPLGSRQVLTRGNRRVTYEVKFIDLQPNPPVRPSDFHYMPPISVGK